MGTEMENIPNDAEEVMDEMLYIIKDQLPKQVVSNLYKEVSKIRAVKSVTDMKAYVVIEFFTKVDADAAKAKGFEFDKDGQNDKINYATIGTLSLYLAEAFKPGIGTGY